MRLTRWQVEILGFEIAKELAKAKLVEGDLDKLAESLRLAITDDLQVEDKLDEEVRQLMQQHAATMRAQGVDPAVMFEKIKKQLVRERKLVL